MLKTFFAGSKLPKTFDQKLVEAAFEFAQEAHKDQKRKSGEPYINHPLAVAKKVLEFGMDAPSVAAALLHDVVEDTKITTPEIEAKFGPDVAMLVQGVTNLGQIDFSAYSTKEELAVAQLNLKNENLRRLFLAMSEDVRVVVIKLADRLHNMETIKFLPKEDQIRIARETLNIFSPLALRLGMGEIRGKLEDLAFPIAYPDEYKALKKEANRRYKAADRFTLHIKRLISDELKKNKISAQISGRAKHIYSLYKKMERPEINWDFDKVYDLVALRIITDTVEDCYRILGIIHGMYRPLPSYIRDYISAPKPNGYRSIHTSVFGPDGKVVEIQIRTHEMHEEAEYGVASHLHYTLAKTSGATDTELKTKHISGDKSQVDFLKRIKEWQSSVADGGDFVEGLKLEFLDDRIYVFSPKGDIYDLPIGATPIDFAYEVHSGVGDTCRGAKVNRKIVPLDAKLTTRDVVEIITDKNGAPKRGWLDIVKTTKAKQHIRSYFRHFDFEKNKEDGERIVADELMVLGFSVSEIAAADIKKALAETSFKTLNDLYASVGAGITTPRQAVKIILRRSFIAEPREKVVKIVEKSKKQDLAGMKVQIAPCCFPTKHDKVICYITRGRGLTAHKKGCKNLKSLESERLIEFNPWAKEVFRFNLEILGKNRVGMLRDITEVISSGNANIESVKNSHVSATETKIDLVISVEDIVAVADIIKKLSSTKDITSVSRK